MNPYDVVFPVQAAWSALATTSLLFVGTITADPTNPATVSIRRKSAPSLSSDRGLQAGFFIEYKIPTDLADVEVQDGIGSSYLILDGNTVAAAAPLSNVN